MKWKHLWIILLNTIFFNFQYSYSQITPDIQLAIIEKRTNDELKELNNKILALQADEPYTNAYKGAIMCLLAIKKINPYEHVVEFQKGRNLLEKSLKILKDDPEIRFLRYYVQSESPKIFFYYGDKKNDLNFAIEMIAEGKADYKKPYWQSAFKYILYYGNLTESQKMKLLKLIKK